MGKMRIKKADKKAPKSSSKKLTFLFLFSFYKEKAVKKQTYCAFTAEFNTP